MKGLLRAIFTLAAFAPMLALFVLGGER